MKKKEINLVRKCIKCNEILPISEFYIRFSKGFLIRKSRCKKCFKSIITNWNTTNKDKVYLFTSKFFRLHKDEPEYKRNMVIANRKSELKYPDRKIARYISKDISIKDKKCEICGSVNKINKHHSSYDKPLDVNFLCHSCHTKLHSVCGYGNKFDSNLSVNYLFNLLNKKDD